MDKYIWFNFDFANILSYKYTFTLNYGAILQLQNNSGNILLSHVTNYSGNATQTLAESGIISIANGSSFTMKIYYGGSGNSTVYGGSYPQIDWPVSSIFINVLH